MKEYDKVKFVMDKFSAEGVFVGTTGYIIEVYPNGNYEVEVSKKETGETIAQVVASSNEIEVVE
ncbi:DUF4926 domain-containing protein [Sedimentibacter sp. zth1]|uniref:DUF4926 domain-containing protein n=1 Tax=Sedimentibacter sp. zth1 TaxID=2816908 RepID=UPI001A92E6E5|nr:DUF4926 domain-containing protein [Sedimentibacter sp. zth1]QSX06707.1 DUF4926 domain-containing protein [Sedimentibacter sp. zth1]